MNEALPRSLARQIGGRGEITIRLARPADFDSLRVLEDVAERQLPHGATLVAESDGELVAALSLVDGRGISDPFRAAGDLVALLRLRASQLEVAAA